MIKYRLENYEEQMTHQVIHMGQAVCYCPEYLGFEYFAYGLVKEGLAHLEGLIRKYETIGVRKG